MHRRHIRVGPAEQLTEQPLLQGIFQLGAGEFLHPPNARPQQDPQNGYHHQHTQSAEKTGPVLFHSPVDHLPKQQRIANVPQADQDLKQSLRCHISFFTFDGLQQPKQSRAAQEALFLILNHSLPAICRDHRNRARMG